MECETLESIIIPNGVEVIESGVFQYCRKLESITIPQSVTTIGNFAFDLCESLTHVYYKGSKRAWNEITIDEYNECLRYAIILYWC